MDSALHAKLEQPSLWCGGNLEGYGPFKFRIDLLIILLHSVLLGFKKDKILLIEMLILGGKTKIVRGNITIQ